MPTDQIKIRRKQDTQSKLLDSSQLLKTIDAFVLANKKFSLPIPSAQDIVNKLAQEGRADLGVNQYDYNYPGNEEKRRQLVEGGIDWDAAKAPLAFADAERTAKRLGKSVAEVFNGTGKVRGMNRTGKDYAKEVVSGADTYKLSENAEALAWVNRALSGKLTPDERLAAIDPVKTSSGLAAELAKLGLEDTYKAENFSELRAKYQEKAGRSIPQSWLRAMHDEATYPNVPELLAAHQMKKRGIDSSFTREYEDKVNANTELADIIGTIAANTDNPYKAPPASGLLDVIESWFK